METLVRVACPTCGKERDVTRVQAWHIRSPKGRSSGNCKSCAQTGRLSPHSKFSPRARAAQVEANTGNRYRVGIVDREHIEALAQINRGNKYRQGKRPWNYQGKWTATQMDRAKFQSTVSPQVLERDDWTCQECGVRGGVLHAAHIKSFATHPELRFDITNCRTLCRKCHFKETFGKEMPEGSNWGLGFPLIKEGESHG